MAEPTLSAVLIGATGMVGSQILTTLLATPSITTHALTRRALPSTFSSPTLTPHIGDAKSWPSLLASISPPPTIFISALGTTRANAGSVALQREIDLGGNLEMARAAKAAGVTTYVLISSASADSGSMMAYVKMKGELEDGVKELGFKHVVLIRPGLLVGKREETRVAEGVLRGIAGALGKLSWRLTDFWAQDVQWIGKAAVKAALECEGEKREEGVWEVGAADIVRLGRDGWQDGK